MHFTMKHLVLKNGGTTDGHEVQRAGNIYCESRDVSSQETGR